MWPNSQFPADLVTFTEEISRRLTSQNMKFKECPELEILEHHQFQYHANLVSTFNKSIFLCGFVKDRQKTSNLFENVWQKKERVLPFSPCGRSLAAFLSLDGNKLRKVMNF